MKFLEGSLARFTDEAVSRHPAAHFTKTQKVFRVKVPPPECACSPGVPHTCSGRVALQVSGEATIGARIADLIPA